MLTPSLPHVHFFHFSNTCSLGSNGSTKFLESLLSSILFQRAGPVLVLECYEWCPTNKCNFDVALILKWHTQGFLISSAWHQQQTNYMTNIWSDTHQARCNTCLYLSLRAWSLQKDMTRPIISLSMISLQLNDACSNSRTHSATKCSGAGLRENISLLLENLDNKYRLLLKGIQMILWNLTSGLQESIGCTLFLPISYEPN
jgi:hypothetical protein